jgi:hypothetical protein
VPLSEIVKSFAITGALSKEPRQLMKNSTKSLENTSKRTIRPVVFGWLSMI